MPHRTRRAALGAVAVPFVASRAAVLAVGAIVAVLMRDSPPANESAVWKLSAHPLANLLARWDTFWYLDIAQHGYRWNGHPLEQQNVVFFPLYPLLLRAGGSIAAGATIWIGLVISLAAFLGALVYVWRWAVDVLHDESAATFAVAALCAFPFAVFFSAVYTESLFLLTAVATFFHLYRHEPRRAAAWALAAGFVRPNGCLLAIPAAWFVLAESRRRELASILAVLAPLVGPLAFSWYLGVTVGDPWAWVADQAAWQTVAPWGMRAVPPPGPAIGTTPIADIVVHTANAAAIVFALSGLVPVARVAGASAALFVAVNIAPPIARHGLLSMGRFTSVLFPLFLWLAWRLRGRRRAQTATLVAFGVGQAVAAALFFAWRPLV